MSGTGPEPIGGQALIEGVMMRRGSRWAAAVRQPDGTIVTTSHRLPAGLEGPRRVPLVRGVLALGESVGLGTRAMAWAARAREPEETAAATPRSASPSPPSSPRCWPSGCSGWAPASPPRRPGIEGRVRLQPRGGAHQDRPCSSPTCGRCRRAPAVRRVFAYHGAEHMTIHAYEHGEPLEPDRIRTFDRRHPRCGTSFLLIVAVVSIAVHVAIGTPDWPLLVASRIIGLPLVAALAYEAVRAAGRNQGSTLGRIVAAPGAWLQSITTREPDDDQIEVAVAALRATVDAAAAAR